jgi:hypothetical protein
MERFAYWVVFCADFAVPTSSYWKASNNYTVDLSEVTYRVYGPDVVNPPSRGLIKAAETVMKAMYEKFCNITAHIVESRNASSAPIIMHKNSMGPSLSFGRPNHMQGFGHCVHVAVLKFFLVEILWKFCEPTAVTAKYFQPVFLGSQLPLSW